MVYGYARVSAKDQNLERQIKDLRAFGIDEERLFCDKKSGKDFIRDGYNELMGKLKKGDLVVVKSIDRFGRDYDAIIKEWSALTLEKEVDILVLDTPLLDTRAKENSLMGKFVSAMVLQILSFVAENERTNIKERQREGIVAAQARGVKFGRPRKKYTKEFLKTVEMCKRGAISRKNAAFNLGISRQSLNYHIKKLSAD